MAERSRYLLQLPQKAYKCTLNIYKAVPALLFLLMLSVVCSSESFTESRSQAFNCICCLLGEPVRSTGLVDMPHVCSCKDVSFDLEKRQALCASLGHSPHSVCIRRNCGRDFVPPSATTGRTMRNKDKGQCKPPHPSCYWTNTRTSGASLMRSVLHQQQSCSCHSA